MKSLFHIRSVAAAAAIVIMASGAASAKPIAGVIGLGQNSPRALGFAGLVEKNLNRLLGITNIFAVIEADNLTTELRKYECLDEQCIVRFARDAGIAVVITGRVEDRGDRMRLELNAYGVDMPYQGRIIYSRRTDIIAEAGTRQFEYIAEEHAALFISRLLKNLKTQSRFAPAGGQGLALDVPLNGTFDAYRVKKDGPVALPVRVGSVTLKNGVPQGVAAFLQHGDYVLEGHGAQASMMLDTMHKRKREIVFGKQNYAGTAAFILATGPASATMPIVAPLVGYYRNGDWYGLSLWAVSAAPYLYLEINGLTVYFKDYYRKKKDRSREVRTQFHFGMYMLCAGGMGLFTDAFSYGAHKSAADYGEPQPFLGNDMTTVFLAMVTGGGGHFYRGKRLWGYLYFHVDNILLYYMIREFSVPQTYNWVTREYSGQKIKKNRAYPLLAAFCAVKTAEIFHAVFLKDEISNGRLAGEEFGFEPFILPDESDIPRLGLQVHFKF